MSIWTRIASGFRLINGDDINNALANPLYSFATVALSTTSGITNATVLKNTVSELSTLSGTGYAVLPTLQAGDVQYVYNNSGQNVTVYAPGGAKINNTAGATGVTVASYKLGIFVASSANNVGFLVTP
jgi:hypothetical protein